MAKGPKLHVIDGGTPPPDTALERVRKRVNKQPKPGHLLRCKRCSGTATMEVTIGAEVFRGRTRGGTKQLICAVCALQGELVVLF